MTLEKAFLTIYILCKSDEVRSNKFLNKLMIFKQSAAMAAMLF